MRKHTAEAEYLGFCRLPQGKVGIDDLYPEMESKWDRSFWAHGYYVATIGNMNETTVKEYIQRQTKESMNEVEKLYRSF